MTDRHTSPPPPRAMPRLAPVPASLPDAVPFVGPETLERQRGKPFKARLGANENGFGPSPAAIDAMRDAAADVWKYGDSTSHHLRATLARRHGVTPDHIVVGEGIDGLLGVTVRLFVGAGDRVVTSLGGYPTFEFHVNGHGGVLDRVPYRDDRQDAPGLVDRAAATGTRTGARLVYLCNPDNPMGGFLTPAEIGSAIARLPDDTVLALDEAYGEFAPDHDIDLPGIDADDPRIIRFRTFSKAYGMAGARIGYALAAPQVIRAFDRVRNHFGVNSIAQAGALAALNDDGWLGQTVDKVSRARARIAQIAADSGLTALPSATNFVAVDCGGDGALARAVLAALAHRDVFVRMAWAAPQDRCIRVSCGPDDELDVLARALPDALAEARAKAR